MKLLAIKVSGGKQWTTTILLNMALEGATSKRSLTELIRLHDPNFQGCTVAKAAGLNDSLK